MLRDAPEICYPSAGTAYPTNRKILEYDSDIDELASEFKWIDTEKLLDQHMVIRMDEWNESGLSIGRVFAMKMFIECMP